MRRDALIFRQADIPDALIAIFVMEESLTVKTGTSIVGFNPSLSMEQCNLRFGAAEASLEHRMELFAHHVARVCRL